MIKTLKELNFTDTQTEWIKHYVSNFQGICLNENEAYELSCNIAEKNNCKDYKVNVYYVWNGLLGIKSIYGYTIGYSQKIKEDLIFPGGIEPHIIDDEIQGRIIN